MSFLSYLCCSGCCGPHYHHHKHRKCSCHMPCGHKPCGRILCGIVSFLVLIGIVIFLVYIILRPSKPEFVLKGVVVYSLNISSSPADTVSVTMQITLMSQNHNGRIGIHYREAEAFASYRGEQVTRSTQLPSTYQGHKDITVWSPFVYGTAMPISPESAVAMREEVNFGELLLAIRVKGNIKWKVGTWTSATYHLIANCPTTLKFSNPTGNTADVASIVGLSQGCNVEV